MDAFPLVEPEYAGFLAAFPGLPTGVPPAQALRPALASLPPPPPVDAIAQGRVLALNEHFTARDGTRLRLLVLRSAANVADARQPVVVFLHGGGFLCGMPEMNIVPMCAFAEAGFAVVSIDYRLCPEAPFPIPFTDALDGLTHLQSSAADKLHLDLSSGLILLGISAGSAIAASIALYVVSPHNDTASLPSLALVILDSPLVDDRLERYASSSTEDRYYVWTRENARDSMRYLLPPDADEAYITAPVDGLWLSANRAPTEQLVGLPPHFLGIMTHDLLRDGGLAYATRLVQAGVQCDVRLFARTVHGSVELIPLAKKSEEIIEGYVKAASQAVGRRQ